MERITLEKVKALAAEKGATLTHKSDSKTYWGHRGQSTTRTKKRWYELSTAPDQKFIYLTNVWDFLQQ